MAQPETVLVTGATGYIGGRLVPRLVENGHRVRVLVRSESRALSRSWSEQVDVVVGDALSPLTLSKALAEADTAYYLIHSMSNRSDFHELDIDVARTFGQEARKAGVKRIIYLGGLGDPKAKLSCHLRSRQETGDALRESGVAVTEFRAAVVIGSGSISFEMIRCLVERLPVMVCPKWIYSRIQPIAVDDLLEYLVSALYVRESDGLTIEIGGNDVTTYRGLMLGYAQARGLRRLMLPVPVLTPRLSSYWVHWMTPVPASVAAPLVEGLRNDVVVTNRLADTLFPNIMPRGFASAIRSVTRDLDEGRMDTSWSDAAGAAVEWEQPVRLESRQGMIVERRQHRVAAPAGDVYRVFTGIGAARGWYFANWAWRLRGMVDRLLGGAGLRRGRRHPDDLRVGDALDCWRVEDLRAGRLLRLRAEMKLPGQAWLQFEVGETQDGATRLEQTSAFSPKGLAGLAYWYGLYPLHSWIFGGLAKAIAIRSEHQAEFPEREGPQTK